MEDCELKLLLNGIDTLQCAYYLVPKEESNALDFETLTKIREAIRHSKKKDPIPLTLGNTEFLIQSYGTSSGYPLVLKNEDFKIELGEFNWPNFFVTYKSDALWKDSALSLNDKFMQWTNSIGYRLHKMMIRTCFFP